MNRKSLFQLNAVANWGSTGKIAEGIGQSAMARGWESWIAYGRRANACKSHLVKVGESLDVISHFLNKRIFDGEGLGSKRPTLQFLPTLDEIDPTIIHLHNIHDHWLNYPLLFQHLEKTDIPIVWTFHDCWAFTGGCYHFEERNCMKWIEGCSGCRKEIFRLDRSKRNYDLKKSYFTSIKDRLTIVCVSKWLADYVKISFLAECDIKIIHNGIDISTFKPIENIKKEKMILGVSNVWPEYKGLNDFIELRKILPPEIGITIVGLTKAQIKSLPEGITGITRTSNVQELAELYNKASVYVNTSKFESFPTVNLEALACGTPVVTYNTGGSPEAIDDKTGLVVEKGNIDTLAEAIKTVIDNPQLFKSEDCRQRAVENFDMQKQFGFYVDLYEELLNQNN